MITLNFFMVDIAENSWNIIYDFVFKWATILENKEFAYNKASLLS
jgi:hypothetical protein